MNSRKLLVGIFIALVLFLLIAFTLTRLSLATPIFLLKVSIFLLIVIALAVVFLGQRFRYKK